METSAQRVSERGPAGLSLEIPAHQLELVKGFLIALGEDPQREGLKETPKRVVKAWREWFGGYGVDPTAVLKTFKDGNYSGDEMVVRKNIPVFSHCEHHLCPIFGFAHIAYIPKLSIVGLSKLDRVVDLFARRLQVQERLTNQIADAVWDALEPKGVGVLINARHMCVESRGVKNPNSSTVTSALRGVMRSQLDTRAEFLELCKI